MFCGWFSAICPLLLLRPDLACCLFFEFELLEAQPCWFTLYQWRTEKRLSRDVFHTSATYFVLVHCVTYRQHTPEHKMEELKVVFRDFQTLIKTTNLLKNRLCIYFLFIPFLSIRPVTQIHFRSPLIKSSHFCNLLVFVVAVQKMTICVCIHILELNRQYYDLALNEHWMKLDKLAFVPF